MSMDGRYCQFVMSLSPFSYRTSAREGFPGVLASNTVSVNDHGTRIEFFIGSSDIFLPTMASMASDASR